MTTSTDRDRQLASYDYELPPEQIAQIPATPRDASRLLVIDSPATHAHAIFRELPDWLQSGDLFVLNDTRVIPARLFGRKTTGATVELLLLERLDGDRWLTLVKPGRRIPVGTEMSFENGEVRLDATIVDRDEATGGRVVQFRTPAGYPFWEVLEQLGQIPLPPYVTKLSQRSGLASEKTITSHEFQTDRYQTVYARQPGAIAAPTAGLHFTEALLQRLQESGIERAAITLHVGIGTFRPVEIEDITAHKMHQEWVDVPAATVEKIRATKVRGGRVIAVGTTVARSLEGVAEKCGELVPFSGGVETFIYPGFQFRILDGLITNFHLPKSSLLMLVSALIGRERLLELYRDAIAREYRFYSFGDAMLILPGATTSNSQLER